MVDPAVYNAPLAGVTIVATGGRLATTVSVAALLVADPALLVTRQRNCAPLSVAAAETIV